MRTIPNDRQSEQYRTFQHWISLVAEAESRLYYRDQTPESMEVLANLAREFQPTVIVELGTHYGLSLRAWRAGAPKAKIIALDLNFAPLEKSISLLPLDTEGIVFIQKDILRVDFTNFWNADDRVLFFIDAHDLPNVPITPHVLRNAVPHLPEGSLVIVDDIWFSRETLTDATARAFLEDEVRPKIDEVLTLDAFYAPYHKGGSFVGFPEVLPLLRYANKHHIDLQWNPVSKNVAFYTRSTHEEYPFDKAAFDAQCGKCFYNPLHATVTSPEPLALTMNRIEGMYAEGKIQEALDLLVHLRQKNPTVSGIAYAVAVCCTRLQRPDAAIMALNLEMALPSPHPKAAKLASDIRIRFMSMADASANRIPGLTLFAVPKAFTGHDAISQRNAITSWTRLTPRPEIILMGDDKGTAEIAAELGLRHIPVVEKNEYGTPLVDSIFKLAQENATTKTLSYINADIILFDEFPKAVALAAQQFDKFLMIGQRLDCDVLHLIDFSSQNWPEKFKKEAMEASILHGVTGMDYFAFTAGLWDKIPPFALGRTLWDMWLGGSMLDTKTPCIDATEFVPIVHQSHGYQHMPTGILEAYRGAEAKRNKSIGGQRLGTTSDTDHYITKEGELKKRPLEKGDTMVRDAIARRQRALWLAAGAKQNIADGRIDLANTKLDELQMRIPDL